MLPTLSVITGGPGAGKTSLCNFMADRIAIKSESGRAVLSESNGHELRTQNPAAYAMAILDLDIQKYEDALSKNRPCLFDRGFADNVGFLNLMGLPVPIELDKTCHERRYSGSIFVVRPWKHIYQTDADRTQNWQEAKETYQAVTAAWEHYGYTLIELPNASLDDRASFVTRQLA
ncbi:MAG: AAA family ATPase [Parasphingorhabdus sp.]